MDRFFTSLPKSLHSPSPSSPSTLSNRDPSSNGDEDRDGDTRRKTDADAIPPASASEPDMKNLPKGVVLGKDGKPYV